MIPNFDHNGVLPPHLGNPTSATNHVSPYPTTPLEFCERFATSPERIEILNKFFEYRKEMRKFEINGFHWLDGSFLEDIENVGRKRAPEDLDMLTFFNPLDAAKSKKITDDFQAFPDRNLCKKNYKLDHIIVNLALDPYIVVEFVRYYLQLFTHNRDQVWKGMLKMDVGASNEDDDAIKYLNSLP